ncbi:MAG: aminotransferase class I/II-fold pyridoxal phosphate-dependent enzyme [Clostridia bacterium]|nr:aminotransferase class I/II-fold pyridoxal phosphate-dependent enzyme [Clostridia bacterium]
MLPYQTLDKKDLQKEYDKLWEAYQAYRARKLSLNMARGKPDTAQLDLTQEILTSFSTSADCLAEDGTDCRNYGLLDGIPEAKRLFAELLGNTPEELIVCGNSSLNLMYDTVVRCLLYGAGKDETPWIRQGKIKFLCPVPGYDRHFAICESLGIEMINVPMTENGPDMDTVERLVSSDSAIKGIWCVPKYSNPEGVTYSDETVRRFAALKPAARDFRVFWDNAYLVHDLYDEKDSLLSLSSLIKGTENANMVFEFFSTSKISFPGAGVAVIASSHENIDKIKSIMTVQTIGYNKLNMLRHVQYFKNAEGVLSHMKRHAALLRPKFEAVLEAFDKELAPLGIVSYTKPRGGYFISLNTLPGCAKRVYTLMADAGMTMTQAGATFPYGKDPEDKNLRIAPSYPPLAEIRSATEILICAIKLATLEKLIAEM